MKIETTEYEVNVKENEAELLFYLKKGNFEKYFGECEVEKLNNWQNEGLEEYILNNLTMQDFSGNVKILKITDGKLQVIFNKYSQPQVDFICEKIRSFYELKEMHVTRMFGSFILLQKQNGELKAVKATPIPIKYCPLMIKLLKEVGGESADAILQSLKTNDQLLQTQNMCKLINDVVIKGGYFDTNRPLNSCEANVLFGASETIYSAMESGILDCAVIVSNNLGTIITTNASNTQGAVKRMTGLFYSSPSEKLVNIAREANIIPVFPYTANIDQMTGVKEAIKLGFKNIAVSVAQEDNILHKKLQALETNGVKIYKFGLCSTGISKETAEVMRDHADVVWSCASKYVKEYIRPYALAQVGIKIPVYIMSDEGFKIIFNHLKCIDKSLDENEVKKFKSPVFLNSNGGIKVIEKENLHDCQDCPHPCI